jgi:hypothetical protein
MDELPVAIKKQIAERLKEVEKGLARYSPTAFVPWSAQAGVEPTGFQPEPTRNMGVQQSPSMQRIMEKHQDVPVVIAPPVTGAAAMALQARAQLLKQGMADKPPDGMTSKRKV